MLTLFNAIYFCNSDKCYQHAAVPGSLLQKRTRVSRRGWKKRSFQKFSQVFSFKVRSNASDVREHYM